MTDRELILLHDLLEDLETDEGVCYKTRSSTCATACPLWYAGAFGDNICLPSVLRPQAGCSVLLSRFPGRLRLKSGGILLSSGKPAQHRNQLLQHLYCIINFFLCRKDGKAETDRRI